MTTVMSSYSIGNIVMSQGSSSSNPAGLLISDMFLSPEIFSLSCTSGNPTFTVGNYNVAPVVDDVFWFSPAIPPSAVPGGMSYSTYYYALSVSGSGPWTITLGTAKLSNGGTAATPTSNVNSQLVLNNLYLATPRHLAAYRLISQTASAACCSLWDL